MNKIYGIGDEEELAEDLQKEISNKIIDELEKTKTDIKDVSKNLTFINHTTMVCDEDTKLFVSMEDIEKMFTKHIKKLKGEM